jgi:hypothetical protein
MQEIKVMVPEDRVPAFYKWFGDWLAGKHSVGERELQAEQYWLDAPDPLSRAEAAWVGLTPSARRVIALLVEAQGMPVNSDELVSVLGHEKGVHGLAGVLGGAGRSFNKAGISDAWSWDGTHYMMDRRIADLLGQAREASGVAW